MSCAKKNFMIIEQRQKEWYRAFTAQEAQRLATPVAHEDEKKYNLLKIPNIFINLQKYLMISPAMRADLLQELAKNCAAHPEHVARALKPAHRDELFARQHWLTAEKEDSIDRQYGEAAPDLYDDLYFMRGLPESSYAFPMHLTPEFRRAAMLEKINDIVMPPQSPQAREMVRTYLDTIKSEDLAWLAEDVSRAPLYRSTRHRLIANWDKVGSYGQYDGFRLGTQRYIHGKAVRAPEPPSP